MKKEYVKPYLAVESFQLDASVASGCLIQLTHDIDGCTLSDDRGINYNDVLFGAECQKEGGVNMMQENPDICYHAMARSGPYLES